MAKHLDAADMAFRKLVIRCNGHQERVAEALGITPSAVSKRLLSEKHARFWLGFKERRSERRARERNQRAYQRRKERLARMFPGA